MSFERYIALALLALSLGYGYAATDILLLPFQLQDTVTPRTMPYLLSGLGAVISFLMLVLPAADNKATSKDALQQLHWRRTALIFIAVMVYGVALQTAGFILSTLAFLFFCSAVLGERRWTMLAAVHVPIVIGFWLLLSQLLGQTL